MVKLFAKLYDKKIETTGLGVFRIFYFLIFFCELSQLFFFRHLIFDEVPYLEPFEINLGLPLGVWMVCVLFLILGAFTRYMTIINYIFNIVFLSTLASHGYHIIYIYTSLNFLCLFLPISRSTSVDRWWQKVKYSNTRFHYNPPNKTSVLSYLLPLYMVGGLALFNSFLFRIDSSTWLDGLGLWYPTVFPNTTVVSGGLGGLIANSQFIAVFLGYLTLVFQASFIFLFWFKRFRIHLLFIGIFLQVINLIIFPVTWSAFAMMAVYLLLVPAAWWRGIGKFLQRGALRPRVTVYYDQECPLCARLKMTVEHFDLYSNVLFKGVQSSREDDAIKNTELDDLLDNIHSVDRQGRVHIGIDTYVQIMDAMRYTLPISLLLRIPGIYHLARAMYRYVAVNREVERCTEDNCGYTPPQIPIKIDTVKLLNNLKVYDLKMRGIMYFFILVTIWQGFIAYDSGIMQRTRLKLGIKETGFDNFMLNISQGLEETGRKYLGFGQHTLLMNQSVNSPHFIIAISYIEENGTEIWLPILDKNGTPQWYNYGLNWTQFTFGTYDDEGKMSEKKLKNSIRDYTAFWSHKNGKSTQNGNYKLHLKLLETPQNGFEFDFLTQQQGKPWVELAKATWKDNLFEMTIQPEHLSLFSN